MRFDQLIFRGDPDRSEVSHRRMALTDGLPTEIARRAMDRPVEVRNTEPAPKPNVDMSIESSRRLRDLWRQKSAEELRQAASTPQHFTDKARQALEAGLAHRKIVLADPAIAQTAAHRVLRGVGRRYAAI